MKPTITVDIDEQGNTQVSVTGVDGAGCKSLTEGLEKALGNVSSVKKTRDWNKQNRQAKQQQKG